MRFYVGMHNGWYAIFRTENPQNLETEDDTIVAEGIMWCSDALDAVTILNAMRTTSIS